jgi:hypothetical protein
MTNVHTIKIPCRTEIACVPVHYTVPAPAPQVGERTLEARARAAARAQGYVARKTNWRRNSVDNHGGFMIVDPSNNFPVAGFRYDMSAEDVLAWCRQ